MPQVLKTDWKTGIRMKHGTIKRIESITGQQMLEWVPTIEVRSTDMIANKEEIQAGKVAVGQVLLINCTQPAELIEQVSEEINAAQTISEVAAQAAGKEMIVIIMNTKEDKIDREGVDKVRMKVEDYMCLENPYGTNKMPGTMTQDKYIEISIIGGRADIRRKLQEEIGRTGEREINNMYVRQTE